MAAVPPSVRESVANQMKRVAQDSSAPILDQYSACFNIANMSFTDFLGRPNPTTGMTFLRDAAEKGCVSALATFCRLRAIFVDQYVALNMNPHPGIADLARDLLVLPSECCLSEPLQAIERHYQRRALKTAVRIVQGGKIIYSLKSLNDLTCSLQHAGKLECKDFSIFPEESSSAEGDNPCFASDSLLKVACRLGLLDLVRKLLTNRSDSDTTSYQKAQLSSSILEACRGGHKIVVEYLAETFCELDDLSLPETPFHWLFMFSSNDQSVILDTLTRITDDWKFSSNLSSSIDEPGIDLDLVNLSGTPLDFAIAVGDISTIKILLDKAATISGQGLLSGLIKTAFESAVKCHLAPAVELLFPHELRRRRSDRLYKAQARLRLSRNESEFEPFGIFDVGRYGSSLSLLLLHGSFGAAKMAVENTIDVILKSKVVSINDVEPGDQMAPTPLAVATRWAPCTFDTPVLEALISRGANFFEMPDILVITRLIAPRPTGTKREILFKLLEARLLKVEPELIIRAMETGDAEIVATFLDFSPAGISADFVLASGENYNGMTLLQASVLIHGATELVKVLLERGASIDEARSGMAPLELSVMKPADLEIINVLIQHGADLRGSRDFPTILHSAARLTTHINGVHVLSHLLRHKRIQELATTYDPQDYMSPVHVACYAANVEAIAALLEVNVKLERGILLKCVSVGKRPHINPLGPVSEEDEDAVYEWKMKVEHCLLYLLDRLEPGHAKTPLHIAMELGNFRRVVEIVEQDFETMRVMDGKNCLPVEYIEDPCELEQELAMKNESITSHTVANAKALSEYVSKAMSIQENNLASKIQSRDAGNEDIKSLVDQMSAAWLRNFSGDMSRSTPVGQDIAILNEQAVGEDDAEEGFEPPEQRRVIILNGEDKPEDLLMATEQLFKRQTEEFGSKHEKTIETAEVLIDLLSHLGRENDALQLLDHVGNLKQEILDKDDPRFYHALREKITALEYLNKIDEAIEEAKNCMAAARKSFGSRHPAYLTFLPIIGRQYDHVNSYYKCIEVHRIVLHELQKLDYCDRWAIKLKMGVLVHLAFHSIDQMKAEKVKIRLNECIECFANVDPLDFFNEFESLTELVRSLEKVENNLPLRYLSGILYICRKRLRPGSHCVLEARRNLVDYYLRHEMIDEARAQQREVYVGLKQRKGPDHVETLSSNVEYAKILQKQDLVPAALQVLLPTLKALEDNYGKNCLETLQAKAILAELRFAQEDMDDWEEAAREVAEGYAQLDPMSESTIDAKRMLAFNLMKIDRFEEAWKIVFECVEKTSEIYGENHERTYAILAELHRYAHSSGHREELVSICRRALKIAKKLFGDCSNQVVDWLNFLGNSLCITEDPEGIDHLQQAAKLGVELNDGKHNYSTLLSLHSAGMMFFNVNQENEALKILIPVLDEANNLLKEDVHRFKIRVRAAIGRCYHGLGENEKAFAELSRATEQARYLWGDSSEDTVSCIQWLAQVLSSLGDDKAALALTREALTFREETEGQSMADVIIAKDNLASLYYALDKDAAAEVIWGQILKILEQQVKHVELDEVAHYQHLRAKALIGIHGFDDAKDLVTKTIDQYSKTKGNEAEETLDARITLARAISWLGDLERTENILTDVIDKCRDKIELQEVFNSAQERLAELYTKMNRYTDAENVLVRLLDRDSTNNLAHQCLFTIYKQQEKFVLAEEQAAMVLSLAHNSDNEFAIPVETRFLGLYILMGEWEMATAWAEPLWRRMKRIEDYDGNAVTLLKGLMTLGKYFEHFKDEPNLYMSEVLVSFFSNFFFGYGLNLTP